MADEQAGEPVATIAPPRVAPEVHSPPHIESGVRDAAWRAALYPFAASRAFFLLITLTASWWIALFHVPDAPPATHSNWLAARWFRWDAIWYMHVAQDGYRALPYAHDHVNLVFFPLYPGLVHLWLQVWPWSANVGAMLVANACFLLAAVFLYRLAELDFGPEAARRAIWLLAFFPTSLFFFAGYSESIFLLCEVLCCYYLRRERWWMAALWGALATAARPTGMVLLAPFVIGWYQAHGGLPALQRDWQLGATGIRRQIHRALGALRAVAPISFGLLAFMAYLGIRFGTPLAFSTDQRSWHRTLAWPWQTLAAAISRPLAGAPHLTPDQLHACEDTLWGLVFLVLTVYASRHIPAAYTGFLWLFWALTLSTPALLDGVNDPLISLSRFLATAFPFVLYLAATPRRAQITLWVAVPFLAMNTVIFISGGWVA